jgi:hypothetical protein
MGARFYVDGAGAWLGAFEGAAPPPGATEVLAAPVDARQVWQFPGWSAPPAPSAEIAPLAFIARFTAAERAAIRAAAAVSAELADWLDRARFARVIDLAAAETVAGMNALVAVGLLSGVRRDQIIEGPIAEAERP